MKVWRDSTKEKSLKSPEMRILVDESSVKRAFVKFYNILWSVSMSFYNVLKGGESYGDGFGLGDSFLNAPVYGWSGVAFERGTASFAG